MSKQCYKVCGIIVHCYCWVSMLTVLAVHLEGCDTMRQFSLSLRWCGSCSFDAGSAPRSVPRSEGRIAIPERSEC